MTAIDSGLYVRLDQLDGGAKPFLPKPFLLGSGLLPGQALRALALM